MDSFRWQSIVVSIILGFGITRILTSSVFVFHTRRRLPLDWLPMVWAATIFLQQVLFWWTLGKVSKTVPEWAFGQFLFLVGQVLTMFLASALVLPTSEAEEGAGLRAYFEGDGRWAPMALAMFNALAIGGNYLYLNVPVWSASAAVNLVLILPPLATAFGGRRVQIGATVVHAILMTGLFVLLVPSSY